MKQKALMGLLILVIGLGIFSIVYAVMNPEQNVFNYISGLAIVVLAMLTMAYVYVTSRQLDVMAKQLKQMEIESRFQSQPLPYINSMDVWIEKPSFFFTPEDTDSPHYPYDANARYWVEPKIKNIGSHPAVCIDVSARIDMPHGDKEVSLFATSINILTLGEKEDYPINGSVNDKFLFAGDSGGALIEALREENPNRLPILNCRILFRNILGGCFILTCKYRLYPEKSEDDSLFVNWLSEIKSFWIKYKNDIEKLRKLEDSDEDKWSEEFEKFKKSFSGSLSGEDVKLLSWTIPGSFVIKSISMGEYKKEIDDIAYDIKLSGSTSVGFPGVRKIRG